MHDYEIVLAEIKREKYRMTSRIDFWDDNGCDVDAIKAVVYKLVWFVSEQVVEKLSFLLTVITLSITVRDPEEVGAVLSDPLNHCMTQLTDVGRG